ncbi:MAG: pilus assembly protein PilM [Solirubrobacterales bacterium]
MLGKKTRSVVGLDIEPGFVAAAEFSNNGSPTLNRAATSELMPGLFNEGEVTDVDGLSNQLRAFFRDNNLPKVVRLGVASQKIVVRVIELPDIEGEQELEAAVRFQAQEELPMPLEQAVLAHRVLEKFNDGETARMRVLMVAARRETIEHLLTAARKAGLDPQLVDLSAFAIVRALYVPPHKVVPLDDGNGASAQATVAPPDISPSVVDAGEHFEPIASAAQDDSQLDDVEPVGDAPEVESQPEVVPQQDFEPQPQVEQASDVAEVLQPMLDVADEATPEPEAAAAIPAEQIFAEPVAQTEETATLYCHVGGLTNLAIAAGTNCVFNRVLQNGIESMVAALAERKALTLEHARQWLRHVGLEREVEQIEGEREIVVEARNVLVGGVSKIADEIRLSLEYYQGSVSNARPVDRVVLAGPAIALAGFPARLEHEVGLTVEPRSLGAIAVSPGALDGVDGAQLTVAAGLAIDEVVQ